MSTTWAITVDCSSPGTVARFWAGALGYTTPPSPSGYASWDAWFDAHGVADDERDDIAALADPDGVKPSMSFLRVPESKIVKNRIHLDLQVSGGRSAVAEHRRGRIDAEVARLVRLGATVGQEIPGPDGHLDHVVMADPEGNEFCVV